MQTTTDRTTFALDGPTTSRLQRLAALWQVSQNEVVRRAVAQAESAALPAKPDPAAMLRAYHAKGGLDRAKAEAYLGTLNRDDFEPIVAHGLTLV